MSRRRAVLRFTLLLLATLAVLELVSVAVFWIHDGAYLSVREELDREASPYLHERSGCVYVESLYPHPYLGYVFSKNPPCGDRGVNNVGTRGRDFPDARQPEKFVVLLTGGSAAVQLLQLSAGSLEEELNRRYAIPGKQIIVLDGAVNAWKEPQQLILFLTHARIFDAVITLDGFNELEIPTGARAAFELPWRESVEATNPAYDATNEEVLALARASGNLYDLERGNWLLSRSKLAHLILSQLRLRQRRRAAALTARAEHPPMSLDTLFAIGARGDDSELFNEIIEHYSDYLRMMDAVAARFGIKTAHFFQPIAAWGKPLTDEERRLVGGYDGRTYHTLIENMMPLRQEGMAVFSLLDLYADWKQTLYIDRVHQKRDSPGYRRMAQRIAMLAGDAWHLPRRQPEPR